jgi:transcription elongation factor GreA
MSNGEFLLTKEGYEEIVRELGEITAVKRPAVIDRIREARQLGDLSENFDYEDAKRAAAMLEARVQELKAILAHAKVVDEVVRDGCVRLGSRVVVKDLDEGCEDEYLIVGAAESSPAEGKISHESCVGSALLDLRVGEQVSVTAPGGTIRYEVVSVE